MPDDLSKGARLDETLTDVVLGQELDKGSMNDPLLLDAQSKTSLEGCQLPIERRHSNGCAPLRLR